MALREEFEMTGQWLFRWRSYLPAFFFGMALLSLRYFRPLQSNSVEVLWELFCLFVSYIGLAIRILAVGFTLDRTSGRNTHHGQVADSVNTTGIYSLTRHPLYLGNFLMWFGISLFPMLWWLSALCTLVFWLYYERIMFAEEAYLREKFGETYVRWAEQTPAFIPSFRNYVRPSLSFSWKKVLRKEYNGFFVLALCLFVMETLGDYVSGRLNKIDTMWTMILVLSFTVWAVLRAIKHRTSLLKERECRAGQPING
jgi:protein-S-isoprenylcysteine O-methyltransferase Ste14